MTSGRAKSTHDDPPKLALHRDAAEPEAELAEIDPAGSADNVALDQSVSAGRDINAPIVNATGDVIINDRSDHLNRLLHDYVTYLVFVSLGIKRPHATAGAIQVVDDALEALTTYHRKTKQSIGGASWGYKPELTRHATATWHAVDKACAAVFGLSFEEA